MEPVEVPFTTSKKVKVWIVNTLLFPTLVRRYGHDPRTTRAFAVWNDKECTIYLQPGYLHYFYHELRHCEEGHWHD